MNDIHKGSALIVEDDKLLSLVEERLLIKLGYHVLDKVESGEEAIEKVKTLDPDFILMDISLRGELDGIDTMKQIRSFSDIPVIYLSGNTDKFNYERAKKTGFVEYLIKPVTADDLVAPLKKATSIYKPRHAGRYTAKIISQAG
jgi:CheY-like chemotaxis protein